MDHSKAAHVTYFRNFVFGVEDSLVSTVGLLSGIAIADVPQKTILITGAVLIFVEAFSMAVGSFLSEYSAEEYLNRKVVRAGRPLANGAVMFFSYLVSGFIPLFPYAIAEAATAIWLSIAFSLAALFFLGVLGAKITKRNVIRSGARMLTLGGIAVAAGVAVGWMLKRISATF